MTFNVDNCYKNGERIGTFLGGTLGFAFGATFDKANVNIWGYTPSNGGFDDIALRYGFFPGLGANLGGNLGKYTGLVFAYTANSLTSCAKATAAQYNKLVNGAPAANNNAGQVQAANLAAVDNNNNNNNNNDNNV